MTEAERLAKFVQRASYDSCEKKDYEGFHTNPMSWETTVRKFERLGGPHADAALRQQIVDTVARLDEVSVSRLTGVLAKVSSIQKG